MRLLIAAAFVLIVISSGCVQDSGGGQAQNLVSRTDAIPAGAVKFTPAMDEHPPVLHSDEYEEPVPLSGGVNTAGAEDSPFIPDGSGELYFFFTPDVSVPVEKQLLDGATGIYLSKRAGDVWGPAERVVLQDAGKLSLDGCEFVQGNTMWFCSAREGYTGLHWVTAERRDGTWQDWRIADFKESYEVGELHISADGSELYFHSGRAGGKGQNDIWVSRKINGEWQEPENIGVINTAENEMMPYLTPDGSELWFNRFYQGSPAIFRSTRAGGQWQEPELIISSFAGEPTLDADGNVYFVHHFYEDGKMIEADIYVAMKKGGPAQ